MIPMCDVDTAEMVGWAVGDVSCDGGTVTITYFDTLGVSQGSTLPGNWGPCRPRYSSNVVNQIVEITQEDYDALGSYDPNTLYLIID